MSVDNRERKSGEIMESGTVQQRLSQIAERFTELSTGSGVVERNRHDECNCRNGDFAHVPAVLFPLVYRI